MDYGGKWSKFNFGCFRWRHLVEVGENEDVSKVGVATPMDDLEVSPIVLMKEGHGGEDINENEDHVEKDDDYPKLDMKDFLG